MTIKINIAIVAQIVFAIIFIVHRYIKPLASDLMFAVLLASLFISIYLFWHTFKVMSIVGVQKIVAIFCACLPIIWLLLLLNFLS